MMANQIAQFFRSYPHDEAVAGTASHIEAFWTPKMIGVLKAGMHDVPHLDPIVMEAFSPQVEAMDPAVKSDLGPGRQSGRTRRGSTRGSLVRRHPRQPRLQPPDHLHQFRQLGLTQQVYLLVQKLRFSSSALGVDLIVAFCVGTIDRRLPVLAHHDEGRRVGPPGTTGRG